MRVEKDSLGTLEIPDGAYYGIQTLRAVRNFPISGIKIHPTFIRAYAHLKKACTEANVELGAFTDKRIADAIVVVCDEIISGKFGDQFVTDVFQAGAGTSTNMNVNEVIANRALELIGGEAGDYKSISPNDHVNMSQSTNDTYPTAMRLAAILNVREKLYPAIEQLRDSFQRKETEFADFVKSGRTHLQDAVPISLGQEFGAWRSMMDRHRERIAAAEADLSALGIGGSAAGTGLNTPDRFGETVVQLLSRDLGIALWQSEDLFEAMQSLAPFVHVMGALKNLALDVMKISADLRLLASGPMTGLAEITLPAVQPGSSIMPGKVNPSILEMVSQVALQVVGCEATVAMASQAGQLELNVMMPVVQFNIMFAVEIFSNALVTMSEKCIDGIGADRDRLRHYAEISGSLVTALAPAIGYLEAAKLEKESLASGMSIRSLVIERKLMSEKEVDRILDIRRMTNPHEEA